MHYFLTRNVSSTLGFVGVAVNKDLNEDILNERDGIIGYNIPDKCKTLEK